MAPISFHQSTAATPTTMRLQPRDYCYGGGPPWCRGGPYLSGGAIAAIVLGVIFFVAIIACICWTYTRRPSGGSRRQQRAYYTTEQTAYTQGTGVRGGGLPDYEVSDFSGGSSGGGPGGRVPKMKKAKTRRHRHSRR